MQSADRDNQEIILTGISGSPGICIGKAYLVDEKGVEVIRKYYIGKGSLSDEVKRFKAAVKKSIDELDEIITDTPEEFKQHAHILETHTVLLKDKMFYDRTIEVIELERVNAEWALKKVVDRLKPMFENMENAYLRDRADDIVHVHDRVMKNLVGATKVNIGEIDKRVILVARDLSPAETSQIQLERIMGFVTDRGGKASHTSIIARTLEIPAVLGLEKATTSIHNDDIIIVDGSAGVVIINPSEQSLFAAEERKVSYEVYKADIARHSHLPAETSDGHQQKIMGNIELPEEVVSVLDHGGEGIGLYRTEFQYLSRPDFPSEEELFDKYKDVIDVMPTMPVTIRTLDINGDKAVAYAADDAEENPALGMRAIRYCLKKPDIFQAQLRAILRAAAFGDVRILFPMISGVEEVRQAKKHLQEAADSLLADGIAFGRDVAIGAMIEVPSAVITADLIAKEVDFFSIGTNDLIQYSLAIDRGNRHVAHLYHPLHPAILRLLKRVCDVAHQERIDVYMCGEMAGEPTHTPILMGLGLDELSMNPQSIPVVKSIIRALSLEKSRTFLEEVLKEETSEGVSKLVQETYGSIFAETIYSA